MACSRYLPPDRHRHSSAGAGPVGSGARGGRVGPWPRIDPAPTKHPKDLMAADECIDEITQVACSRRSCLAHLVALVESTAPGDDWRLLRRQSRHVRANQQPIAANGLLGGLAADGAAARDEVFHWIPLFLALVGSLSSPTSCRCGVPNRVAHDLRQRLGLGALQHQGAVGGPAPPRGQRAWATRPQTPHRPTRPPPDASGQWPTSE